MEVINARYIIAYYLKRNSYLLHSMKLNANWLKIL